MVLRQKVEISWCAVFSLEPLAQDLKKEIMDFYRINQFTPLLLSYSALPTA
jgi:hypothetical protein